jgi:phage terminase large subunit GpA-like protein
MKMAINRIDIKPRWMSPALWDNVKGGRDNMVIPQIIKKVCRKRKKIAPSAWAERHRTVIVGPLAGTRYKKETIPYANGIMDASFYDSVEEIVLCCADQVAKSFIIETCAGYAADRKPGPMAYTFPDEETTTDNVKDRLLPMFRESPRLKSYMTGLREDETHKRITLSHMTIYATWAGSSTKLANKSIKYIQADEVDKFPETAGKKEGAPLDKLRNRFRTYKYGRKMWISSTPTIETGPIWVEINDCNIIFEYWVCCPDCGTMQIMVFEQIRWPEDVRDPAKVRDEDLANYVCPHCGSCWTDIKRDAAAKWGEWRARSESLDEEKKYPDAGMELFEYLRKHNPRKIGFHVPSWLSRFVRISEVAEAFLRSLKNKVKLKQFNNSHRAYPWTDWTEERQSDRILDLRDDRPRGQVPCARIMDNTGQVTGEVERIVSCLTMAVDTQDIGFWYEVRAWGYPDADLDLESWQVREGYVRSFDALKKIMLVDVYKDVAGNEYMIRLVCQDAMGHRTDAVYNFCRLHRRFVIPTQGVDTRRMTERHSWSNQDKYPGTKKPIPGGITLLRFDANYYKDVLASKLEINPEDPGAWHLHSETSEDWAIQMCSEYVNEKGLWEQIGSRANHAWDVSALNLLAADVLGLKYMTREKKDGGGPGRKARGNRKDGFIPRREGWLRRK